MQPIGGRAAAGDEDPRANVFSFLITTDNHLGFMERDPRRGDDSFIAFDECLRVGRVEHDVDACLLAGDLFHENKPTLTTMKRTMSLFKQYCLGSRPVTFALVSDPEVNFPTHVPAPVANFEDPNTNVAMPVFIIHGNHDDPVGGCSAIDILAAAGLVNYFGQVPDVDDIIVRPILLRKGSTNVAVYGMGNVRDERLHRCLQMKKVRFVKPLNQMEKWFNILLVHQNRGVRGGPTSKGGVFEPMLQSFGMDLIVWGNEHEQLMTPRAIDGCTFEVIQPGSTVMTSLSAAECNPKQCAVLEVCGTSYRLTPHTLTCCRPVVRRLVELSRANVPRSLDAVDDYLSRVMESMVAEADDLVKHMHDDVLKRYPHLKFPLMRLSVNYEDIAAGSPYPQPNVGRFGLHYMDVVVNPGDLLKPVKPPPMHHAAHPSSAAAIQAGSDAAAVPAHSGISTTDIRRKITDVFASCAKDACAILAEAEVASAIHSFVEKSENGAVLETIGRLLTDSQKAVWKKLRDAPSEHVTAQQIAEIAATNKTDVNKRFVVATQSLYPIHAGGEGGAPSTLAGAVRGDLTTGERLQRDLDAVVEAAGTPDAAAIDVDDGDDEASPVTHRIPPQKADGTPHGEAPPKKRPRAVAVVVDAPLVAPPAKGRRKAPAASTVRSAPPASAPVLHLVTPAAALAAQWAGAKAAP